MKLMRSFKRVAWLSGLDHPIIKLGVPVSAYSARGCSRWEADNAMAHISIDTRPLKWPTNLHGDNSNIHNSWCLAMVSHLALTS